MRTYQKIHMRGGFTLIELLVVVAIIGLLASVVVVSLQSARLRGKDAAVRQEAAQLRTLLEQEYSETGSYAGLQPRVWIDSAAECDTVAFTGAYRADARNICKVIIANASVSWSALKFYLGTQSASPNAYSIMIALPYKDMFLCVGSSGRASDTSVTGNLWTQPGCFGNP